jgi:hypothetical protein
MDGEEVVGRLNARALLTYSSAAAFVAIHRIGSSAVLRMMLTPICSSVGTPGHRLSMTVHKATGAFRPSV